MFFSCFLSLSYILEVCSWFNCLILVKMWFRCGFCVLHERTMASTGFLTQASLPRLGEISRGSPRTCCSNCRLDDEFLFLSEEWSRLSEKGLAWARPCKVRCSPTRVSPRRDRARLSERTSLAWAGPVSLSETGG